MSYLISKAINVMQFAAKDKELKADTPAKRIMAIGLITIWIVSLLFAVVTVFNLFNKMETYNHDKEILSRIESDPAVNATLYTEMSDYNPMGFNPYAVESNLESHKRYMEEKSNYWVKYLLILIVIIAINISIPIVARGAGWIVKGK